MILATARLDTCLSEDGRQDSEGDDRDASRVEEKEMDSEEIVHRLATRVSIAMTT
jgi:hypothetical protein